MAPSDRRLISKLDYEDIFAPSWIAANGRLKDFQSRDIYAVNVPATCEKLMSLVTTPQTRSALVSSSGLLEGAEEENVNMAPERKMPFRMASSLCYGTLRIYKIQVDRLLNMSRDLCARSKCELKVATVAATKRKSSYATASPVATKKRRYAKKVIQKETTTTVNFSNMMNEAQELIKWSANFDESDIENYASPVVPVTQKRIQMREITIRETNLDMVLPLNDGHEELDYFGVADNAHSAELVNHFQDYFSQSIVQSQSLKRKKATEQIFNNNKLPRICSADGFSPDSSIELPRCGSAYVSPINCNDSSSNTFIIQQNCENDLAINTLTQIDGVIEDTHIEEFETWANAAISRTPENQCIHFGLAQVADEINNTVASPPETIDLPHINSQPPPQKKIRIDKRTELLSKNMLAQIERCARGQQMNARLQSEQKSLPTAHELLANLNRNMKAHSVSKKKHKISQEVAAREYLNLVGAIFSDQPQASIDDLAAEIHPIGNMANKRKRKLPTRELNDNLLHELEESVTLGAANGRQCNKDINQNQEITLLAAETTTTAADDASCIAADDAKWHPYGVMMQLLNIWRSIADEDNIAAKRFCLSADNRLHAAMAFGSLLVLAAKRFIVLKKSANSIEMETIELGSESYKLITTVKT